MTKRPIEFRQEIMEIIFPKEVKKEQQMERKREREKKRSKLKIYKASTVKWNQTQKGDMKKYKAALKNAKKLGLPLATYIKEAAASNRLKPFLTEEEQEILSKLMLEIRRLNTAVHSRNEEGGILHFKKLQKLSEANKKLLGIIDNFESLLLSTRSHL